MMARYFTIESLGVIKKMGNILSAKEKKQKNNNNNTKEIDKKRGGVGGVGVGCLTSFCWVLPMH